MQYIYIRELEDEKIEDYISKVSGLDKEQELTIFIDSSGGNSYIRELLYKMLKDFNYHLVIYCAFSNALILFDKLRVNAKSIEITQESQFMVHLCGYDITYGDGGKARGDYGRYKKQLSDTYPAYKFDFLTKEQEEKYIDGEDIFIMPEQIRKFLAINT